MILSYQSLKAGINGVKPMIIADRTLFGDFDRHIQPATLDLPIGDRCYRIPVSGAPKKGESVEELIQRYAKFDFEIKPEGARLERGLTYILPLAVDLNLPNEFRGIFSAKSTTARNGLFSRNLTDGNPKVDLTAFGYGGKLYIEVSPLRFETILYPGTPLSQLRIASKGAVPLTTEELLLLHAEFGLVRDKNGEPLEKPAIVDGALELHLDLTGERPGYKSRVNLVDAVNVGKVEVDDREKFWRKVTLTADGEAILHPGTFYLFATQERICIPPCVCAFMEDYSANIGEFSSHEAGFFDNWFGGERGTQGVLEVHPSRMPIRFWDGRPICRMVFYKTDQVPEKLYGSQSGSHYVGSGPSLAKNFKNFREW